MAKKRKRGERGKRGWTQNKILLLMAKTNRAMALGELRRVLDMDKSTIYTHLTRLEHKDLVLNRSDGWILNTTKPSKDFPYDFTREENLKAHYWMNTWFTAGWTKKQSDELSKTKWYKKNIKLYRDKPPFESNFENDFTNWVLKGFDLAHKYPNIWEKVFFYIVKQPQDPSFFHYINLQGKKNRKIKLPDKLW